MVKENQKIELINHYELINHNDFHLINCIIDTIDLIGVFELNVCLTIDNCIVNNLKIHSCWFVDGLLIRNSIINNYIDYQMGGHNIKPIIIEGNIFMAFFNFFDCHFENTIELKNNIFTKGTNLLGNKGEGFENSFAVGYLIENNVGSVDINEINVL